jgi:Zn-dependent peptidase ImmA (M78 family)/transcriptional regulator with XRE-family HTH domain
VTPEVLRWAREASGYTLQEAARHINVYAYQLEQAEEGADYLTLRQAEKLADFYDRPLAMFFMPEPPAEEPQETQFRRLPGAPEPPWPPEMRALARRVRRRQEAAAEIYELIDETPPWQERRERLLTDARSSPANAIRAALGVSIEEQVSWEDARGYLALRQWTAALEALGILVMQDGTMPVETMRGFASIHDTVPAIVANTRDDPRARVFTLVHELAHLVLGALGALPSKATEQRCESIAGEVLMPSGELRAALAASPNRDIIGQVDAAAARFGVTPLAAAVRAARAELFPPRQINAVIRAIRARPHTERRPGGDYYRRQIGRLGPGFISLVFSAVETEALTYPAASRLLDVKVNNFDRLRDYVEQRAQPA